MSAQFSISAKTLGELAVPGFCPRCFWIKLHAARLPFQIFPGIFSSIDAYTKQVVHGCFDHSGTCPSWLGSLGELVGYIKPPHYSKFKIVDSESGVTLWGTPDGILKKADGSHVIVDYKTARYTSNQDRLLPMYEVQLNGYAVIGEQCGLKPVSGLALIYMEPVTGDEAAADTLSHRHDGFAMGFSARLHMVDLKPDTIPPLLARAREIYELNSAPDGHTGCKDCVCLEDLLRIAGKT